MIRYQGTYTLIYIYDTYTFVSSVIHTRKVMPIVVSNRSTVVHDQASKQASKHDNSWHLQRIIPFTLYLYKSTFHTITTTMTDENHHHHQYLFIIRHGDRWDYSSPEWKSLPTSRTGDSPLSTLGHQQAQEVGRFLDKWLGEHQLKDVVWMSSPFLRCLQTSNDALNAMPTFSKEAASLPILPEYSIFEWDGNGGAWHKDLPALTERKHYFPRLDMAYETFFVPTLPEPRSEFFARCQRSVDCLHRRFPYKPGQVLVAVTHAAGCIALAKTLTQRTLQEITPAGPCSIFGFSRPTETPVWTLDPHDQPGGLNGYTDHLSQMGSATRPWNNFGDGTLKFYTGPPTSRFAPPQEEEEQKVVVEGKGTPPAN